MGGGTYSQDVANEARSSNTDAFSYQAYTVADDSGARRRGVHPKLNPYKTRREVNNETPIVVALDVTRSRGDDTKLMYEKLPMLMGQIALQGSPQLLASVAQPKLAGGFAAPEECRHIFCRSPLHQHQDQRHAHLDRQLEQRARQSIATLMLARLCCRSAFA